MLKCSIYVMKLIIVTKMHFDMNHCCHSKTWRSWRRARACHRQAAPRASSIETGPKRGGRRSAHWPHPPRNGHHLHLNRESENNNVFVWFNSVLTHLPDPLNSKWSIGLSPQHTIWFGLWSGLWLLPMRTLSCGARCRDFYSCLSLIRNNWLIQ